MKEVDLATRSGARGDVDRGGSSGYGPDRGAQKQATAGCGHLPLRRHGSAFSIPGMAAMGGRSGRCCSFFFPVVSAIRYCSISVFRLLKHFLFSQPSILNPTVIVYVMMWHNRLRENARRLYRLVVPISLPLEFSLCLPAPNHG